MRSTYTFTFLSSRLLQREGCVLQPGLLGPLMVTVDGVAYNISAPGGIGSNPFTFTVNLTEVISNARVCTTNVIDVAHTTQAGSKTVSLYYDGKVTAQAVAVSVVSGAQPCQHISARLIHHLLRQRHLWLRSRL
jgi:hypothetical protein